MATLTGQLFSRTETIAEDEEQLLRLFWNRAELKKELAELRNDVHQLTEELQHEQGLKLRVQQRYEQLEAMLSNPATAASAETYYQLRDIWNRCFDKLSAIADDLSRSHRDREYRLHVAGFRRKLYESLTEIQGEFGEVTQAGELLREQIRSLREQRAQRLGFWNFFRRRKLTAEINRLRSERRAVTMRLGELTEDIQARSSVSPPEFAGLEIDAKRIINLTTLAYAQELYVHFAERDLSEKAREAYIRQLSDIRYGDREDCRRIAGCIEERIAALEADRDMQGRANSRAQFLEGSVKYRSPTDTIPDAETMQKITLLKPNGKPCGELEVNVLASEYWDIYAVLIT